MKKYECYVCGSTASDDYELNEDGDVLAVRRPVGWSTDSLNRDRCPKHAAQPTFATLGDILRAKLDKK